MDSQLSGHSHYAHPPLPPPLPALALTFVVRRIATAACYGRRCRLKATSFHGDLCTGFPLSSLLLPSKLPLLFSYRRQNSIDPSNLLGAHPIKTSSYQGRSKALLDRPDCWTGLGFILLTTEALLTVCPHGCLSCLEAAYGCLACLAFGCLAGDCLQALVLGLPTGA
jgi:hypothetical protein